MSTIQLTFIHIIKFYQKLLKGHTQQINPKTMMHPYLNSINININ